MEFFVYECIWSIQAPSGMVVRATVDRTTAYTSVNFTMVFMEGRGIFGGTTEELFDFNQDSFAHTSSSNFLTLVAFGVPPVDPTVTAIPIEDLMDTFSDLEFTVTYEML